MTTVVSSSSQSDTGDVMPENWSNSSIKPSSSTALPIQSWVDGSFSSAIVVSITSFIDGSVEIFFSIWLSGFFLKLYISYFAPKNI